MPQKDRINIDKIDYKPTIKQKHVMMHTTFKLSAKAHEAIKKNGEEGRYTAGRRI